MHCIIYIYIYIYDDDDVHIHVRMYVFNMSEIISGENTVAVWAGLGLN